MDILNLGAGTRCLKDAVNHDLHKHHEGIDIAHDLNVLPWPWEDDSFDKIVSISVFEHLQINLLQSVDECWRILRPGGILFIKLPHWKHDNAYVDPTHYWRFSPHTLKMFVPGTKLGDRYGFYTTRKWKFIKPPELNEGRSSFAATMEVIK